MVNLNLQINVATSQLAVTACTGYNWNGRLLTKSGKYSDTLQTPAGCDSIANLDLVIYRVSSSVNSTVCEGQSYNGHTSTGTYTDTFTTTTGCDSVVTLHLIVLKKPAPDLGAGKEICAGDSITLRPGNFLSYQWQDGSTEATYVAKKAGIYSVTVTNACGTGSQDIQIIDGVCKMYFPNAFTPNNDGRNDRFMLLHPYNLSDFRLSIYNRYGQKVFETKDYKEAWAGTYKGVQAQTGTYVWYSEFKEGGVSKQLKGTVVLVR